MSDGPITPSILFTTLIFILIAAVARRKRSSPLPPPPPGPTPLPLFGNVFSIPKRRPWLQYAAWSRQYHSEPFPLSLRHLLTIYARVRLRVPGDLISVRAYGQLSVIANTSEATKELLDRRSAIYSDRPQTTMVDLQRIYRIPNGLCVEPSRMGWKIDFTFLPYSEAWRTKRRMFHQHFRESAIPKYHAIQQKFATEALKKLLDTPQDFLPHLKKTATSIAMAIAYDRVDPAKSDRFVHISEQANVMLSGAVFPGAALANAFPFLRHLPEWLPGMHFKSFARRCAALTSEMRDAPFDFVKHDSDNGIPNSSVTTSLLESNQSRGGGKAGEDAIKDVAVAAYTAKRPLFTLSRIRHGVSPSFPETPPTSILTPISLQKATASLVSALLALLLHPHVQRRAQAELDAVVGRTRLPTHADRAALPLCSAICREVFRWNPIAPLGISHAVLKDDVTICTSSSERPVGQIGTHVIPNAWAILHDPEMYPDPDAFKPERFLNADGSLNDLDVQSSFGFGRRICPGRHLADSTLWISVASILAVFTIEKAKDENGAEIPVRVDFADGLVSHPLPFDCSIRPRDERAVELILEVARATSTWPG
ncbi:hypothetical protein EW146_g9722 [Bondarzewia mesenterica]|uniref:Cytochrome P450 n=1 Tax=Bondarzewia mesenterica TaxID=1095465 RepID=A0A4S4L4D8_9AGAM|nr:hypothetical protein EW146_g9722 [Bondarzewia mesenterica]